MYTHNPSTEEEIIDKKIERYSEQAKEHKKLTDAYFPSNISIFPLNLVPTAASFVLRRCYESFGKHDVNFYTTPASDSTDEVALGSIMSDYIDNIVNASNNYLQGCCPPVTPNYYGNVISYINLSKYMSNISMDDLVKDSLINYCKKVYVENLNNGNNISINEILSPFANIISKLGMNDIIPILEAEIPINVPLNSTSPNSISLEPPSTSPYDSNLRSYERTYWTIRKYYDDEFVFKRRIQSFENSVTFSDELTGNKECPFTLPDGHYISLAANHKLNDIFNFSKKKGVNIFDNSNGQKCLIGPAVASNLLKTVVKYTDLLDSCSNDISDYADSTGYSNLTICNFRLFLKQHLGIPLFSGKFSQSINSKLQEYENKYNYLKNTDLSTFISDSIVNYFQANDKLKTHTPHLLRSIIPDLKKLGMDSAIPYLQEQILSTYGKDLSAQDRFAIRYPITSISPDEPNSDFNILPHHFHLHEK